MELEKKGMLSRFKKRLELLQNGAPISTIQEIRDEVYILERIHKK